MGNKASSTVVRHPKLGDVTCVTTEREDYLKAVITVADEVEAQRWEEGYKEGLSFKNNFLFLPFSYSIEKTRYCSSSRNISLSYENFTNTLKNDILERATEEKRYSGAELWRMLFVLAKSATDFEINGIRLGNLHPESILTKEEGRQVRVINRYSWPGEPIGIQQVIEQSKGSYVSPKELDQLSKKKIFVGDESDGGRNDAFSIGITVLEMGTLLCSQDLYDFFNCKIDEARLRDQLSLFSELYLDAFLQKTVQNLCELAQAKRPTCGQLHALLAPYQGDILGLRPFKVDKEASKNSIRKYQAQFKR